MLLVQVPGGFRLWISVYAVKTVRNDPGGGALVHFVDDTSLKIAEDTASLVARIKAQLAQPNLP